ncbi:hypothetical protein BDF21DRAFT_314702, partial [Thamnidium elegans]
MPPQPITGVTDQMFLTELAVFDIIKTYFCDLTFGAERLNDWVGKDGSWGIVNDSLGFTWEDVSNVKEFRKTVRTTSPTTTTIGYARRSN